MTHKNPNDAIARTSARPVAWSSRIDVHHLGGDASVDAAPTQTGKRGSSKIEKEIIWAVVVLYAGLIACFAGLHLFGLSLG
ncbi:hypothetical protein [Leucobacter komagatae]|uniref:Uncharacterized protein n=1 Tax=Leucobacter komagatae TaxID=55969 RepID=A0A0D0H3T7_9MICO|nr:hypothetical protein [Leucobacter komagatae]KIP51845.1 hypothetical protein SD72_12985 [Leucobacter komagatae]